MATAERYDQSPFRALLWTALLGLLLMAADRLAAADESARALLDRAREISYTRHWSEAQALLDELAPRVDQLQRREFVDFHLLEARHLALADRTEEALARAAMLLALELDVDQHIQLRQFSANIAVLLRRYELAFDHLLNALALEPDLDDPFSALGTFNMAAYLLGRVDEYEQAINYGERAVALALAGGNPNDECVARQRLAPVFKWADQAERAELEYRRAIEVCLDIGNALFAGVLRHGLADLLRREGRVAEALEQAEASVQALRDSSFVLGEFEARLALIETQFDLGLLPDDHEAELASLRHYFSERDMWDQLARLEELLARYAEQAGDATAAIIHMRAHLEAREQFLGRDRAMRLAYLQVAFGLRIKEQQINLLEESARASQLEVQSATQRRRAQTTILLLSLSLMVVLTLLLIRVLRGRQHFRELSRRDRLSGLANHGWFFERAEMLLKEADLGNAPAFLVLADIDRFKLINDQYGHLVGDQVLGQIARRLGEAFPPGSLIGRIGGEEFAILLLIRDINGVIACVEQFRQREPSSKRADDPEVTVSFGIARYRPGESLDALRQRADEALYQAKAAGRDRYIVASAKG